MDRNLHRYWIRIEPGQARTGEAQFGITAYSETDALEILGYLVFTTADLPQIAEVVADVDVQSLDQGHVIPNMHPPNWRGIWYPKGYGGDLH